ncbi:MAG: hypothetical protein ORO03_04470, partial [Alphaproteobacteria bacterium]|nr:hypothetical protein [Alphaproteobacteria bacterium]
DLELGGSLPTGLVASQINGIVEASGVTLGSLQNLVFAGVSYDSSRASAIANFTVVGAIRLIYDNDFTGPLTLQGTALSQPSASRLSVTGDLSLTATGGAIGLGGVNRLTRITKLQATGGGIALNNNGDLSLAPTSGTVASGGAITITLATGNLKLGGDLTSSGGAVSLRLLKGSYDNRNSTVGAADWVWTTTDQGLALNAVDYLGSKADNALGFRLGTSQSFESNFKVLALVSPVYDLSKQNYYFTTDSVLLWDADKLAAGFDEATSQWLNFSQLQTTAPARSLNLRSQGEVRWLSETATIAPPNRALYFYNVTQGSLASPVNTVLTGYSLSFLGANHFRGNLELRSDSTISQAGSSGLEVTGVLTATSGGDLKLKGSQNELSSLGTVTSGGALELVNNQSLRLVADLTSNGTINLTLLKGDLVLTKDMATTGGAVDLEMVEGRYDNRSPQNSPWVWTTNNQNLHLTTTGYLAAKSTATVFEMGTGSFTSNHFSNRSQPFNLTKQRFYFTSDAQDQWSDGQQRVGFNAADSQWLDFSAFPLTQNPAGFRRTGSQISWNEDAFIAANHSIFLYNVNSEAASLSLAVGQLRFLGVNRFAGDLTISSGGFIAQANDSRLEVLGQLSLSAGGQIQLVTTHESGNHFARLGTVAANGTIQITSTGDLALAGSFNSNRLNDPAGLNDIKLTLTAGDLILTRDIDSQGGVITLQIAAGGYDNRAAGSDRPWLWSSHGQDMVLNAERFLGDTAATEPVIDLGSETARLSSSFIRVAPVSVIDASKSNYYFTSDRQDRWAQDQAEVGFDQANSQWLDIGVLSKDSAKASTLAVNRGLVRWSNLISNGISANSSVFFYRVRNGAVNRELAVRQVTFLGDNHFRQQLSITANSGVLVSGTMAVLSAPKLSLGAGTSLTLDDRNLLNIADLTSGANPLVLRVRGDFSQTESLHFGEFQSLSVEQIAAGGGRIALGGLNQVFAGDLSFSAPLSSLNLAVVSAGDLRITSLKLGGGTGSFRTRGSLWAESIEASQISFYSGGSVHLRGGFAAAQGRAAVVYLVSESVTTVLGSIAADQSL